MTKKLIAFAWYGGKYSHLDFILPNLPNDAAHFVDVFGGSAAVILNKKPAPVETYNDVDSELTNFFKVLRNKPDDLIKLLDLTPFSREELAIACQPEPNLSELERARQFFIRARQTRTGLAQSSSKGRWSHCILTSRSKMSGSVSAWLGSIKKLPEITQRLREIQIENSPALDIIKRYDTPETLFYLDPPYSHKSRNDKKVYTQEMTDKDHEELAEALNQIKGRAVISGYRTELYDTLFKDWDRVDDSIKICHSSKGKRQESLWRNFELVPDVVVPPGPEPIF